MLVLRSTGPTDISSDFLATSANKFWVIYQYGPLEKKKPFLFSRPVVFWNFDLTAPDGPPASETIILDLSWPRWRFSKGSVWVCLCCILFPLFCTSEQYEAFLKFNHDQLHRRFGESAASCKYWLYFSKNCMHSSLKEMCKGFEIISDKGSKS